MSDATFANASQALSQHDAIQIILNNDLAQVVDIKRTKTKLFIKNTTPVVAREIIRATGSHGRYNPEKQVVDISLYGQFFNPLTITQYLNSSR